jgi:23S rRNA (uracil1939-C5)-methyltransferase
MTEDKMIAPIQARIEKMVYGGEGLARVQGQVLLAPLVLPGELVEIQLVKDDPRLLRGCVTKILETSPRRVAAACQYFTQCGGCHYQQASYEDQLRFKSDILVETLRRIGKLDAPEPEIVSGEPWAYRNRAQFKVVKRGRDFHLGYLEAASNRLVDIEACPIVSPAINALLPELREVGHRSDFKNGTAEIEIVDGGGEILITVRSDERFPDTLVTALRERVPSLVSIARGDAQGGFFRLWGGGHVTCTAGGFGYRVSHGVFFQVNRFLADTLADIAVRELSGKLALDLYAGAGFFTLPLARRFEKVEAVETNSAAVRDLRANCGIAKIDNVGTHRVATTEYLAGYDGPTPDAVLLDPPRAGLGHAGTQHLAKLGAPVIVYVACDPPTLSRDLALLVAAGYKLEKVFMVDLFPQTFHIESVVVLRKG